MSSDWFYKSELVEDELEQGDLLRVTEELRDLLVTYHPHYAGKNENEYYAILTQSCDLALRAGECGARYISMAPVRSLRRIVHREFGAKLIPPDVGAPYGTESVRAEVERFLERLLNNNESSYFHYLAEAQVGLVEPMCAVLALAIPLKAEHYDLFLRAKIIGIADVFQAKLGWLLGQLYSRVGTPDMDALELRSRVQAITDTLAVWFSNNDFKHLQRLLSEHRATRPEVPVDAAVSEILIQNIPRKKAQAVNRILDIATEVALCGNPSKGRHKFRNALEQDPEFAQFF